MFNGNTMAKESQVHEQEFFFKTVQLFKSETLGTGSYGAVCKAKCDQLICAAKLLYPVLFKMQTPDPAKEHRQPEQRFKLECGFLRLINHPNIVQYLGTYHDPDTNAPVLLMELMDESLTHFLESSPGDIPYHIQVNISNDIAQALAFLHANHIIHRDLSSNNVLLIGKSRAKVTDFGMSKLVNVSATHINAMTTCPGTPAFMPPEALNEPPVYTEKLDNFSLGVIIVQILTLLFPKPESQFETIEITNPQDPSLKLSAQIPVPEVKRRETHISLIDPAHPLLPTALDCLKDQEADRPTSQQVCQTLGVLKDTTLYKDCSKPHATQPATTTTQEVAMLQHQIRERNEMLQTCNTELEAKTTELKEKLRAQEIRLHAAEEDVQYLDNQLQTTVNVLRNKDKELEAVISSLEAKEELVGKKEGEIGRLTARLEELYAENKALKGKFPQEAVWVDVRKDKQSSEQDEAVSNTTKDKEQPILKRTLPERPNPPRQSSLKRMNKPPGVVKPYNPPPPARKEKLSLSWNPLPSSPYSLCAGSSAVLGNRAYFKSRGSDIVVKYESKSKLWSELPQHPISEFTIVCAARFLTTVGGWSAGKGSDKLYCFIDEQWTKYFPPMPTKRASPAVVYSTPYLIVAGGYSDTLLSAVEVLHTKHFKWSAVCSLPFPMAQPSVALHEGSVYIAAGDRVAKKEECTVIRSSLSSLIVSRPRAFVWERIAKLPFGQSTLTSVGGYLLAFGGCNSQRTATKDVYCLNKATNLWDFKEESLTSRCNTLTAVLPENRVIVVGSSRVGESMSAEVVNIFTN